MEARRTDMENLYLVADDDDPKVIDYIARKIYPRGGVILVCEVRGELRYRHVLIGTAHRFGNETEMEEPKVYQSLGRARAAAKKCLDHEWKPAMWIHPDSYGNYIGKYFKMEVSKRVPGSCSN